MSMGILEAFVVSFAIDPTKFTAGRKEVEDGSKKVKEVATKSFSAVEEAGKKTAEGVRSISKELLGMFLAFQGGSSIAGFLTNMVTGAAAADRFGKTIGMNAEKVMAWQRAMKKVGGNPGEADSSLAAMEGLKQQWQQHGLGGDKAAILQQMGITEKDLKNASPGDMLMKLAGAKRPFGDEGYANRLQQLGLSSSMINFLMEGKASVEKTIKAYEQNSAETKKEVEEAKKMQAALSDLSNNIQKLLVPALNKILPPLIKIADFLAKIFGDGPPASSPAKGTIWSDPFGLLTFKHEKSNDPKAPTSSVAEKGSSLYFQDRLSKSAIQGGPASGNGDPIMQFLISKGLGWQQALGIRAGIQAESRGNPNALGPLQKNGSRAYGIGQWLGSRQKALFAKYGSHPTLNQQLDFMWSELQGGDPGGKKVLSQKGIYNTLRSYITDFMRPQGKNWEHRKDWQGDMGRASTFLRQWSNMARQTTTIGTVNIYTQAKDPKAVAAAVRGLGSRSTVVHADQGVRP